MKAWAIKGNCGLYYGTYSTRRQAIADHVAAYNEELFLKKPSFQFGPLNDLQKKVWAECRARGDQAVKVKIIAQESDHG